MDKSAGTMLRGGGGGGNKEGNFGASILPISITFKFPPFTYSIVDGLPSVLITG